MPRCDYILQKQIAQSDTRGHNNLLYYLMQCFIVVEKILHLGHITPSLSSILSGFSRPYSLKSAFRFYAIYGVKDCGLILRFNVYSDIRFFLSHDMIMITNICQDFSFSDLLIKYSLTLKSGLFSLICHQLALKLRKNVCLNVCDTNKVILNYRFEASGLALASPHLALNSSLRYRLFNYVLDHNLLNKHLCCIEEDLNLAIATINVCGNVLLG